MTRKRMPSCQNKMASSRQSPGDGSTLLVGGGRPGGRPAPDAASLAATEEEGDDAATATAVCGDVGGDDTPPRPGQWSSAASTGCNSEPGLLEESSTTVGEGAL